MRNRNKDYSGSRRFVSFVSYAFTSILFDVVAYTLSSKVAGVVSTQYNIMFYFPSLGYNLLRKYALGNVSVNYGIINTYGLLLVLPVVTFFAGIILEKIIAHKFQDSGKYRKQWQANSEN